MGAGFLEVVRMKLIQDSILTVLWLALIAIALWAFFKVALT